jgi:HD-GYP domain-containing protein (c-di-GMP phosphodiesterase class II)
LEVKITPSHRTLKFFRYLLFILLIAVPLITYWNNEFSSLYVITFVILGISLWNFPSWYLFVASSVGLIIQIVILEKYNYKSPLAFFVSTFIYLAITFMAHKITKQYLHIQKLKNELILGLSSSLDSRDAYTGHHSENVARYALMIAKKLNFTKEQCDSIYIGGLLHDIGKIGIPESILTKPTKLTKEEYNQIKLHPTVGYNTIKNITSITEIGVLDMVLYHHERYDGKGYPTGLKGEEIPLVARILCVADSFDAMTTTRSYRKALNLDYAISEIKNNRGTQFDPLIADIFLEILEKDSTKVLNTPSELPIIDSEMNA